MMVLTIWQYEQTWGVGGDRRRSGGDPVLVELQTRQLAQGGDKIVLYVRVGRLPVYG